jgi:hypothetical protein
LTFAPGVRTLRINVPVIGGKKKEDTERFFVNLSAPANATIVDGRGVGTIFDDDRKRR